MIPIQPVPLPGKIDPMQKPQQVDNAGLFFQALQARQAQQRDQVMAQKALADTVMSMASLMEKKREADMENAQGEAMLDFKNRLFAHESELKDKQFAQKKMIEDYLLFNAAPTTTDVAGKPAVVTPSKNGPQVKFAPTGAGSRGAGQPDDMYVSGADAARYGVSAKTTYGQLRQMNAIPMSDKTAQDLAAGPGRLAELRLLGEAWDAVKAGNSPAYEGLVAGPMRMLKAAAIPSSPEGKLSSRLQDVAKTARELGHTGVLTQPDVEMTAGAAYMNIRDSDEDGRRKIDITIDLAEENQFNKRRGLSRQTVMTAPPVPLSVYVQRKKSAGVSPKYMAQRVKTLISEGRVIPDK